ncbi:MAG: hypothetical protein KAR47_14210, partial [Planctomycetes bacterium]|nr:hypothetical protein [Planctomycetota bacterium]
MAKTFSLKTFFRNVTKEQLKKYFTTRKLLADFDWSLTDEKFVEVLYLEIEEAGGNLFMVAGQDFGMISDMSDEEGILCLIDIIRDLETETEAEKIIEKLMKRKGFDEKALWVFLEHPAVFEWAIRLERMEHMTFKHDCIVGPRLDCKTEEKNIEELKKHIQKFFKRQGRGRYCHIDPYERKNPERYCFFAYPEDYAKRDLTYKEGTLVPQIRRPVLEIVFIYEPDNGILKISAGRMRKVEVMQDAFCKSILGLPGIPDGSTKVYKLSPLIDTTFRFVTDPVDGIESVTLKMLKARISKTGSRRLTCEGEPENGGTELVRKMLTDAVEKYGVKGKIKVLKAKIGIQFKAQSGRRR